jgi:hypothetical protein
LYALSLTRTGPDAALSLTYQEPERRRLRRASWILALILIFATCYQFHVGGGWNVMTRIAMIRAIFHDHTLSINRSQERTGDKAEYPPGSGIYYCDKPVGAQILGFLGYVIGHDAAWWTLNSRYFALLTGAVVATFFASGLPAVVLGLLMLRLLVAMGLPVRRSVFAVLLGILGTLLWTYATVFYGHEAAASLGMISFICAFFLLHGSRHPWLLAFLAGMCGAWATISEFPAAFTCAVVLIYLLRAGLRYLVPFVLGTVWPVAVQLLYNQACFGSPFRFGYMYEANKDFANPAGWVSYPRLKPLLAICFSTDKGIFFLSPVLIFACWGLYLLIRNPRWRREGIVAATMVVGFLLYNAGHYMWQGGVCFGPRHLVSMLPFLILGLPFAWEGLSSLGRAVYVALAGWSLLVSFAAVTTIAEPAMRLLTGEPGAVEALVRLSVGMLDWPNLGMCLGLPGWASIVVHALLLGLLTWWVAYTLRPRPDEPTGAPEGLQKTV